MRLTWVNEIAAHRWHRSLMTEEGDVSHGRSTSCFRIWCGDNTGRMPRRLEFGRLPAGRVIAAHLSNGASLCAMRDGRSIETTMGFTTLDGLVMGTRRGSIGAGTLLYLQQVHGLSGGDVGHLLYRESGLPGVSGVSNDMRVLESSQDPHAKEAIELFVYRIVREIGALASSLGGLDALIFSAGIGEHMVSIRATVCEGLAWMGIECDAEANARHDTLISTPYSRVHVCVIRTDEEAMIAAHTARMLRDSTMHLQTA